MERLEWVVGGEEDYDVGAVVCFAVVGEFKHVVLRHVRLNDKDVGVVAALHHFGCDVFRRRFAEVVDVWLERESHHCDCWLAMVFELEAEHCVLHFLCTPECLVVVDFARFCNQLALNGEVGCEEVWVDGNAVSAHAASRLQDVDARMLVGEGDELPHVDARLVADERQLVGEGNLHVARGVFGKLAHLCRLAVCAVESALHELAVESDCLVGRRLVHTADHAVVVHQFVDYVARQHTLRAVCYMDFAAQLRAEFEDELRHLVGCANRRSRLDDVEVAFLKEWDDGACGSLDV